VEGNIVWKCVQKWLNEMAHVGNVQVIGFQTNS